MTTDIINTMGEINMPVFSTTAKSGGVTFASAQLKAVGSIYVTSPLTLYVTLLADQNGNAIPYTVQNKIFTITSLIKPLIKGEKNVSE